MRTLKLSAALTIATMGAVLALGAYLFGVQHVAQNIVTNEGLWVMMCGIAIVTWAMFHYTIIPAVTESYETSLARLLWERGHLLFSGWRLWFTISIVFLSLGALVFAGAVFFGNGDLAYKAGIVVFVSTVLLLINLKKLP